MICFNLTILTENCLVPIYKSLWINRVGLRGLDLSYILSWRSKTGSHWSRASCSHWWSKGRRLNILGLVRRILNSHWWSSELLWLFHNWWTILWNFSIHWIVHWWRLNCLNWRMIYLWIYLLRLRLRNLNRWLNNRLFNWRWSYNLMNWFLLNLVLWLHLILMLRIWSLYLSICRIKCR